MNENERLERRARDQERSAARTLAQAPRHSVLIPEDPGGQRELYGCWNGIPVRYARGRRVDMPDVVLRMFRDCGAL